MPPNHRNAKLSRRMLLTAAATLGTTGFAGCSSYFGDPPRGPTPDGTPAGTADTETIGYARADRDPPGGTPMGDMPELAGELTVYSGRGEFLVGQLMQFIRDRYPDLTLSVRYGAATDLANQIRTEGQASPADVFFTVNAGTLGLLANDDRLQSLPAEVLTLGRPTYQDPGGRWIGTSGRVRAIPYNTDSISPTDLPEDILAFPDQAHLQDEMGWAVTYGSFQGFITVMRILNGETRTREWLEDMTALGIQEYSDEFRVAQAVADGEITAGFTNHYYVIRVLEGRPNAPLDMAFTRNDAGSFFNVAGAGIVDTASDASLAAAFIQHLLSAEAQDYFARSATFEYPMIPEVEPISRLPPFEALNPPDVDFAEFANADLTETIRVMEEAGVL